MKHRMAVPLFFSFLLFSIASVLWFAGAANAQVSGPCTATIAGVDANSASTPQTAVEVEKDQSISIEVTGPDKFTGHKVMLEFAGIQWTVNEQTDDGKSWSDSVDVAKYSKYGVGLYKVIGVSTGNPCSGTAYVNVKGSPLGTAAGAGAAAATVVGVALAATSVVRAGRRPGKQLGELQFSRDPLPPGYGQLPPKKPEPTLEDWAEIVGRSMGCVSSALPVFFQTMAFMVSGAGAPGAPVAARKVGFKPLISVVGVIGAFLAGLGALVLAQQFGIVYPTRTVTIVWLVAAVVIDVLLTTVARRAGVKKAFVQFEAVVARASAAAPEAQA